MPATPPSITFWGAAHTVTGSMHLLEAAGRNVLLDCGLYQGRRDEANKRNRHFPFDPASIDFVILSHAHLDHCGNLPNLVRHGFKGPIYCTPATRDLMAVMLADSAKIQEEDAAFLNKVRGKGERPIEPLYDRKDVVRTMRQVEGRTYWRHHDLGNGFELHFVEAGHLLGSAMVHLTFPDPTRTSSAGGPLTRSLTFTGDLGRRNLPILRDPSAVPPAEVVITECTYGGRVHPKADMLAGDLAAVVSRTVERGGKVIVPAFSLGRTQQLVYFLHQLIGDGRLPRLPIYVDSPLAAAATNVFRLHPECFDDETAALLQSDDDLFGENLVRYVRSVEESKNLNRSAEPGIIIAASGMCEAGRILHHLKHNIEDPRNTVLIIGFQAPNTLGRRIVDKAPEVRIHDRLWKLNAEVAVLNGFSGHADKDDLHAFLAALAPGTKKLRLVHGEADQAQALMDAMRQAGFKDVAYPDRGDKVTWE